MASSTSKAATAAAAMLPSSTSSSSSFYPHSLVSLDPDSKHAAPNILSRLTTPAAQPLINGESKFVRTASLLFDLDGRQRRWDIARSHPSVSVIIWHRGLQSALVVRQFRPAVWAAALAEAEERNGGKVAAPPPLGAGLTCELAAGILDKDKSEKETAAEEVAEECGFRVSPVELRKVASYHSAIGISGARHTVFAVSVDDDDKVKAGGEGGGGGVASDGEAIETLALPLESFDAFCEDETISRSAGLMFGLSWLKQRLSSGLPIGETV